MIKAIIFDVGGVLIRTADHTRRRQWETRLGLAPWESEQLVFNSEMGTKAQRGEVRDEALWTWVGDHLQLNETDLAAFARDFWAGDMLDAALMALIRRLKSVYQTAVLSNQTDALRTLLTDDLRIADAFDTIVISAEVGVMKPDPRIYQITLERLGCAPQEAIFIDDFAHNVDGARAVGMTAVHFTPQIDLPRELAHLGVQIPPAAAKETNS